jgi:hypothetical protein
MVVVVSAGCAPVEICAVSACRNQQRDKGGPPASKDAIKSQSVLRERLSVEETIATLVPGEIEASAPPDRARDGFAAFRE